MAQAVYSLRIFATGGLTVAAGKVGPLVPDGLVYVVRDIDVVNETGASTDEMVVFNQTGGHLFVIRQAHEIVGFNFAWRGRQVYNVGEQVAFQSTAGTWSVSCSGYQLTLP